ncbi:MAG: VOC family protein [Pseudobdellovibrionaceae bacterium]
MALKINSIIFHTTNLTALRDFYESTLELEVGSFEKDGQMLPDCSETYVNYDINGVLLCFEYEHNRVDQGTIVINVESITRIKTKLDNLNIPFMGDGLHWLKVKDPDGRSLIIEPSTKDDKE